MTMAAYFLNKRDFKSKDGFKQYHVLTVCDLEGQVSEFFHELSIPELNLFDPVDLDVNISKYKNTTKIDLVGISFPQS